MTSNARIFVVKNKRDNSRRLVRALSRASAKRHVATDSFEAYLATQDDLAELLPRGIEVESAGIQTNPQSVPA